MRVNDETRMVSDFVVECSARGVGRLRLPIHATTSGLARCCVYSLDEFLSNAKAPMTWTREKVLQIADLIQPCCAAMKQVVYQADNEGPLYSNQRMNRFGLIVEPIPCGLRNCLGQGCVSCSAVKGIVAVPELSPLRVVVARDGSDGYDGGHATQFPCEVEDSS